MRKVILLMFMMMATVLSKGGKKAKAKSKKVKKVSDKGILSKDVKKKKSLKEAALRRYTQKFGNANARKNQQIFTPFLIPEICGLLLAFSFILYKFRLFVNARSYIEQQINEWKPLSFESRNRSGRIKHFFNRIVTDIK